MDLAEYEEERTIEEGMGLSKDSCNDGMEANPTIWEEAFLSKEQALTAQTLEDAYQVDFSPRGSNKRHHEDRCIGYWRDFLEAMEGKKYIVDN